MTNQECSLFFDWLHGTLGYKTTEDWYCLSQEDILKNGGATLLESYYHNSLSVALQCVYPNHHWQPRHTLEYLPAYSPDFNDIEPKQAQAKIIWKKEGCSVEQLFAAYAS